MNITKVELLSSDLQAQKDFYTSILDLPAQLTSLGLEVTVGATRLLFTQAPDDFEGAYHFAFNIPENQFIKAKEWTSQRVSLLRNDNGEEEFPSKSWHSDSIYFKDVAGNVLEFIARHTQKNVVEADFDSGQILSVSEIGLPSEDVVAFANEICSRLNLSTFKQAANPNFTPIGDDDGLFILPAAGRIWKPNSGVPAKLLPVKVSGETNGRTWEVRGVPYQITG